MRAPAGRELTPPQDPGSQAAAWQHMAGPDRGLLRILTYNACSLLAEGRLESLVQDLEGLRWDVVLVQETWREAAKEECQAEDNIRWLGSGGQRGRCGVGFLAH